jgi:hypothetical protein
VFRITHPRPQAGRQTALGLTFTDGVATADTIHPERALALTQHGYTITEPVDDSPFMDLSVKELRELAAIEGLDVPKRATKPELVAAFIAAGMESD